MNSLEKYKDSGILEMYVCGQLSEEESKEVTAAINEHPELKAELEEIENALLRLASDYSPGVAGQAAPRVQTRKRKRSGTGIMPWIGTAAAIVLLIASGFLYINNRSLEAEITNLENQNDQLKEQIINARGDLAETQTLLDSLRSQMLTVFP